MTNTPESLPSVYLGCPVWSHNRWQQSGLAHYGHFCNSIEGNTTFYQTPTLQRAQQWADAVDNSFKFCFKLPQQISHYKQLIDCKDDLSSFWQSLSPLHNKISMLMVQLPAQFGPQHFNQLSYFIESFNLPCELAVEVRHIEYFKKQKLEKNFNQLLIRHGVNRVIFDSRALFAKPPQTNSEKDAQRKKPYLPVNVIATGTSPVVRFIGGNSDEDNDKALKPWVNKCHQWRSEGKTPYIYLHRPDNGDAPLLLNRFVELYNSVHPLTPLNCNLNALLPSSGQNTMEF